MIVRFVVGIWYLDGDNQTFNTHGVDIYLRPLRYLRLFCLRPPDCGSRGTSFSLFSTNWSWRWSRLVPLSNFNTVTVSGDRTKSSTSPRKRQGHYWHDVKFHANIGVDAHHGRLQRNEQKIFFWHVLLWKISSKKCSRISLQHWHWQETFHFVCCSSPGKLSISRAIWVNTLSMRCVTELPGRPCTACFTYRFPFCVTHLFLLLLQQKGTASCREGEKRLT